jgi:predicted transcriptional regulator
MIVQEMVAILQAEVVAGVNKNDNEISGGYASDLLSNVMSQGKEGNVWVTMHGHQNIVAVASLLGLSAVIIAGQVQPDKETVNKADAEEIPLLTTALSVFEVVGLLYEKGVKGV